MPVVDRSTNVICGQVTVQDLLAGPTTISATRAGSCESLWTVPLTTRNCGFPKISLCR